MHPASQIYTAFVIENKKYEWLRMPFGLTNAPKTFQKAMDEIFNVFAFVKVYLDDIIIHSTDFKSHEKHLETVISVINKNNIKINISKSEFYKEKIIFLGHCISEAGIGLDEAHKTNFKFNKPKNKKGIQKLLGFLNYFKAFIKRFSEKTLFLTDMLRNKDFIKWNDQHTEMYMDILKDLKKAPILKYPDHTQDFILETDASDRAIGAVLKQKDEIVGLYSHKFSPAEERYTSMEKEAFGILKSMEFFKPYVIGSKIVIYTDNRNLLFNTDLSKRVQRWKLLLEEFNYELKRIKGKNNKIADMLSRIATLNSNLKDNYWTTNKNLIELNCKDIVSAKNNFQFPLDKQNRLILPEKSKFYIIKKLHHDLSHPGSKRMYLTICKFVTSKNLKKEIEYITRSCHECQINKEYKEKISLHTRFIYSNNPFEFISSDIFGPIKTKHFITTFKNEFFYILTFTDICTRFTKFLS
ncbi:Transposon Tf2-9 polyprotein [Dictyocoela muelleri]|nr:Transposon Tf2-9 polyprotein [Dictyocoela muelleri]